MILPIENRVPWRARNIIARNNISRKFLVFGVIGQPWLTINSFANLKCFHDG
jgi:hypothetical protein